VTEGIPEAVVIPCRLPRIYCIAARSGTGLAPPCKVLPELFPESAGRRRFDRRRCKMRRRGAGAWGVPGRVIASKLACAPRTKQGVVRGKGRSIPGSGTAKPMEPIPGRLL
jgi:hypothetical protein